MVKHRKGVNQRKRQANKRGEAGPAREEEQADEKLQRARELLEKFAGDVSILSQVQCDQEDQVAEEDAAEQEFAQFYLFITESGQIRFWNRNMLVELIKVLATELATRS